MTHDDQRELNEQLLHEIIEDDDEDEDELDVPFPSARQDSWAKPCKLA
jgi:hypothetical protein